MGSTNNQSERAFSIKLWPPSESTRLMLVERMTDNLSSVSFFSRKYGLLSKEEAAENAKRIEETAFLAANDHEAKETNSDDSSVVQFYAREASRLMLEALKRGPTSQKQESEKELTAETVEVKETIFDISRGDRGFVDGTLAEDNGIDISL